ncbi:MAG: hypothetical protein ABIU77_04415 [Ferruginibacter sp.]
MTGCNTHSIIDDMPVVNTIGDSTDELTILGAQRANPYTVANMTQSYNNLGLTNVSVTATNKYVRFLPNSGLQLSTLDSIMDVQNLELFDAPMDYDVVKEGTYYQDPTIPDTMVTWQYAVVPTNFVAPAGTTYQVLSQIHIPTDTYVAVETEAERLASIQDSIACSGGGALIANIGTPVPNVPQCGTGYHWNYTLGQCVCDCCPTGYHWDGTQCAIDIQSPPPPPPSPDQAVPAGTITVHDTQLTGPISGNFGVRKARVVAKRWFKIERVYTDNSGHFQCTKRFKHKVKINVKFKNDDAQIRNVRGVRFWQIVLPVTQTIGVFSGDKSAISYTFVQYPNYSAKGNVYWTAATVHNGVQEYRDMATVENTGLPAQGLRILLTRLTTSASTPLFHKRYEFNVATQFVLFEISPIASIVNNLIAIVKTQIDITIGWGYGSTAAVLSDNVKGNIYHELTHTVQYQNLGTAWYTSLFNAEVTEILTSANKPYSPGTDANGPIIALGESWAYYMGHYMADKTYGTSASCQKEQRGASPTCNFNATGHPHIDVEENFNPNLGTDPFKWIPQGVYQDLRDNTNEILPLGFVNDNVSNFTNQQMAAAFQSNIFTLQDYKAKLILLNPTNTTIAQVNNFFVQYHY